jgi:XTP/dITP diphosphohydrolase
MFNNVLFTLLTIMQLNTSNPGKFEEFKCLFAAHGIELDASHLDLDEIDASPEMVIAHKASQMGDDILVEDTSLDVDGADVGVNVRWLIDHLEQYAGKEATWVVYLGKRKGSTVELYRGEVKGTLVSPRGDNGFGFDPVFLPNGSDKTLAEAKPDSVNARALAVQAVVDGKPYVVVPVIESWDGPWQESH